jgi:hypothetical protein
MKESKHSHNQHLSLDRDRIHHRLKPYWDRAQHSWLFWVALSLMLIAMMIFVVSDNLLLRPFFARG